MGFSVRHVHLAGTAGPPVCQPRPWWQNHDATGGSDGTWVRKTLVPRLDAEGLRVCIDHRDLRLGAPLVLEMGRAVEQSCYTLAILSPAYLTSNFTELENVLAEHLGLEKSQRRLLAVMREDCAPRLGIPARLWLEMTNDDQFETDVACLVHELRQPPDA